MSKPCGSWAIYALQICSGAYGWDIWARWAAERVRGVRGKLGQESVWGGRYYQGDACVPELTRKSMCSLQAKISLKQKNHDELIGSYGAYNTVVRKKKEKVAKAVSTCFFRIVTCISSAIPKWSMQETSELPFWWAPVSNLNRTLRNKFHIRYWKKRWRVLSFTGFILAGKCWNI